jgi:hypothetical protein
MSRRSGLNLIQSGIILSSPRVASGAGQPANHGSLSGFVPAPFPHY